MALRHLKVEAPGHRPLPLQSCRPLSRTMTYAAVSSMGRNASALTSDAHSDILCPYVALVPQIPCACGHSSALLDSILGSASGVGKGEPGFETYAHNPYHCHHGRLVSSVPKLPRFTLKSPRACCATFEVRLNEGALESGATKV